VGWGLTYKNVFADEQATELPDSVPGVTAISAELLAQILTEPAPVVLIDARISQGRGKGYIEGSIHLPDIETNCEKLAHVAPSLDTRIIFFCGSSKCGRSLNAVRIAQQCGYFRVLWFRGGFEAWKTAGFPYVKPDAKN
jgi:rhodanese-related sulfurtransferase